MATVEGATTAGYASTRSPSFTFGTSPVEGDVIVALFGAVTTATMTGGVDPADWTNALGASGTVVNVGTACTLAVLTHVVTAAEDAAGTVTWTPNLLWGGGETGTVGAIYIRDADLTTLVDASGTVNGTPAATPHSLAAVVGADVTATGGLVLRGVIKDGAGNYVPGGEPVAGHTTRTSATGGTTQNGMWLGTRDVDSVAATDIDAVDITPQNSDEYASFTLVISPVGDGGEPSHPLRSTITPRRELRPHICWG